MFLLIGAPSRAAEGNPGTPCPSSQWVSQEASLPWPGGPEPQLAEVATNGVMQLICCRGGENGKYMQFPLEPGTPVLIDYQQAGWACGYATTSTGGGSGWIRSNALHKISFNLEPPLKAWTGTWAGEEDTVVIHKGAAPGTLSVNGSAQWHGWNGVIHGGSVDGIASPSGNRLFLSHPQEYGCEVYMTLMGDYIVASDNGSCGGMNVRFMGIWKRGGH